MWSYWRASAVAGAEPGTILDLFLTARPSQEKRPATQWADLGFLVAPTGFEPATSALRGRRPKPLDDGATYVMRCRKMAGVGGVEPPHTAPETAVLPLDDTPSISR